MQKYFISSNELENKLITSDDVFHIKNVMRGRVGDKIIVSDGTSSYIAKLTVIGNKEVAFDILEERDGNPELPFFISIFQGYPKGDKIEDVIKHGTELGVYEVVPTLMKRSVFKLDPKKKDSKLERFRKIAKEAAEQSDRSYVPVISDIKNLKEIDFSEYTTKIICYEESAKNGELTQFKKCVKNIKENEKVAINVGPEGGKDESEINYLLSKGFVCAAVGKRILRTETVVFYCLSAISYEWELK
ncbi:MAG: 16S rRNA (uracil(1498)-N(3))-methyltransferase [Acholeplasmatales bacterium]|nr:16S rRNA (uracil(1498)-N(3))-methyltransferase [Acholeplasmatales bacterium]